MQTVLTMVWERLLPAFKSGALRDPEGDESLQARLGGLTLPAVQGQAPPLRGAYRREATFLPAEGSCEDQPSLSAVRVRFDKEAFSMTLCEGGDELKARLTDDRWVVTDHASSEGEAIPVACSGGWQGPAVFRADFIFLETPHRLSVTCNLEDKTFGTSWASRPGHASRLRDLRAPTPPRT